MITFKCMRCKRTVDQMDKAPMKIDWSINEYVALYPEMDIETLRTIYMCKCGRLNSYMNMVEVGG